MALALSLHIGLNSVDPTHYQGWSGPLTACEADAKDMQAIAISRAFTPRLLLTNVATRQNVMNEINDAANRLDSGDFFFLTYSGHGGQLPDINGDELDQQDETWCLFDGQLVDDEIYSLLGKFRAGVRIFVLSDSCHSGTMLKMAFSYGTSSASTLNFDRPNSARYRAMPNDVARRVYQANTAYYDPILKNKALQNSKNSVAASTLLISGCQDNQFSADGAFNGLFTGTLLRVWSNGAFNGSYRDFHGAIVRRMPPEQTPNFFTVGATNTTFESQTPLSI